MALKTSQAPGLMGGDLAGKRMRQEMGLVVGNYWYEDQAGDGPGGSRL